MAQEVKISESQRARRRSVAERTRGMFAHVAPGVSLVDELIADRRAEVHTEELAEKANLRGGRT